MRMEKGERPRKYAGPADLRGFILVYDATNMPALRPLHKVAKAVGADHLPEDHRPGIFVAFFRSTVGAASL